MNYKLELIINTVKTKGALFQAPFIYFLLVVSLISCKSKPKYCSLSPVKKTIVLPFEKSQFLRYPLKFFNSIDNRVFVDYSIGNDFCSYIFNESKIDTFKLPNNLVREYFVRIDSSQVLFLPRNLEFYYVYNKGKWKCVKLPSELTKYELCQPLTTGIHFQNNKLYFGIYPKEDQNSNYINKILMSNLLVEYDELKNEYKLLGNYPEAFPYQPHNDKYNRVEFSPHLIINNGDSIIINFPLTAELTVLYNGKKSSIHLPFVIDTNTYSKCDVCCNFERFYYDKYRNKYYITYTECNPKNAHLHQYEREWYIIVLNNKMTFDKVIKIEPQNYCRAYIEIIKEGVLLTRDFSSHICDTSKYKTYDLFEEF